MLCQILMKVILLYDLCTQIYNIPSKLLHAGLTQAHPNQYSGVTASFPGPTQLQYHE